MSELVQNNMVQEGEDIHLVDLAGNLILHDPGVGGKVLEARKIKVWVFLILHQLREPGTELDDGWGHARRSAIGILLEDGRIG